MMSSRQPLVSIFMPVYNREKYLAATLDSILAQDFTNFELVLADDGSTDASVRIAKEYAARDPRIRVLELAHAGEVATRNSAIDACHPATKYLMNHDSDDLSLPKKLSSMVSFLESHPEIAIVGCEAHYMNDEGKFLGLPPIETAPARIRETFGYVNSMINSACLIRREVFKCIGKYREEFRSVDDYDFYSRALTAGFELCNLQQVLHVIRLHPSSVSATRAATQRELEKKIQSAYVAAARQRAAQASKKLSILHTVEFYWPHVGGAELVVKEISERLAGRGHEVTVATTRIPEREQHSFNGVEIVDFDVQGKLACGVSGADAGRYADFINNHPAEVMLNYAAQQWATDLAFAALAHGRKSKVNVLAPCGYSALADSRTLRWPEFREYFEKLMPLVLPLYDAAVYHSALYKDFEFSKALNLSNAVVIPNGVDEREFERPLTVDFRKAYGIEARYIILCVANFYGGKGQDRVIESFCALNCPEAVLVLIGREGPTLSSLKQQALGLNVKFLVNIPREHTVAAFRSADLFLFGSEIEASPLVIIEAKAAGLPFVSTDCGNVREWAGGVVCRPEDLAAETAALLSDAARRRVLGQEGQREWRERLTWSAVADQYEALYLRLAEKKLGPSRAFVDYSAATQRGP
jgi:glycosyltransferase involved in cell wall biosynthesis